VATVAHQRGRLHITGEPDDQGKRSQGFAIHAEFRSHLSDPMQAALDGKDLAKAKALVAADPEGVHTEFYDAMQATYRWLRADLSDRLHRGLQTTEFEYYSAVAEGNPQRDLSTDKLGQTEFKAALGHAATVAYQRNDPAMEQLGWKKP
jgi:hypothetical protein